MLELIKQPWPWYTSGIAIAFIMVLLIYFGKTFGFSSNLRTLCTLAGAGKRVKFFDFDWRSQKWNLLFLLGSILGGFISANLLSNDEPLKISAATLNDLKSLGVNYDGQMNPSYLFGVESITSVKGILLLIIGGVFVGFGTRYAGGCTSGHAISGLSNLQIPSLVAVVGFFAGGLVMTHFILPLIF